jgi:hypothetical protein
MEDDTTITPFHQPGSLIDPLTEIAREGARQMLAAALKAEPAGRTAACCSPRDRARAVHPDRHRPDGCVANFAFSRVRLTGGHTYAASAAKVSKALAPLAGI